jgi:MFS transporter, DHA1 family, multidrug resistance protein
LKLPWPLRRELPDAGKLWRLSIVTVLGYAAILGFTTWAPTTLVGFARIPLWAASLIASMLLIIDIPFAPMWGAVSDQIGRRRPFVIAAFTVYLIGSLLVPWVAQTHTVVPLVLVIVGMGIGCAMFFPAALTIPAETVTKERVGAAYGLFFTAQVTGMLAGPVLIGQLLDTGTPALAFFGVSGVTALGLAAAFTLRSR